MRFVSGLVSAALLWGCSDAPLEHVAEARQQLADAAYADALAAADAGLQVGGGDPKTSWGLEMVKLEALARSGQAEETKALIRDLAARHPERIPNSQYAATADQLDKAGEGPAAIEVLDLGMQRYPNDPMLAKLIGAQQSGDMDPAELEMLRTLGYVE